MLYYFKLFFKNKMMHLHYFTNSKKKTLRVMMIRRRVLSQRFVFIIIRGFVHCIKINHSSIKRLLSPLNVIITSTIFPSSLSLSLSFLPFFDKREICRMRLGGEKKNLWNFQFTFSPSYFDHIQIINFVCRKVCLFANF